MITEDYVSFETAKLLKDKGFDAPCRSNYRSKYKDYKVPFYHNAPKNFNDKEYEGLNSEWFSAPTLQMAIKWLREVHHLAINIGWTELPNDEEKWYCIVISMNNSGIYRESTYHITYEEACEAAIKYCIKHLI